MRIPSKTMTLNAAPLPKLEQVVTAEMRSTRTHLLLPPTLRKAATDLASDCDTSLNETVIAALAYVLRTLPAEVVDYLHKASFHRDERNRRATATRKARKPRRKKDQPQLALLASAEG